ncbi:MAG TPA: efflux RND transporter periplasmic adaptor subunit [Terriglobia bacterium]|nr:efflux RND transporter periplasmic adaptor subunit [Terriglobia bacterium]
MRNFILGFLLAAVLGGGGYWFAARQHSKPQSAGTTTVKRAAQQYHCPMHPTYVSDKPGDCPICGMRLIPIEKEAKESPAEKEAGKASHEGHKTAEARTPAERKILYYVDPMNPQNRSDKLGKAPDGMDLVPVYSDETAGVGEPGIPGYVPVKISQERQQMMGITLDEAKLMDLQQSIRTVGLVAAEETRLHHVHTKFEGYIQDIYVNSVGQPVKKGDPLFSVYSPDLWATQKEYLLALRAKRKFDSLGPDSSLNGIDLLESARQRLSLWDIRADEIAQLEKTEQPLKALEIYSPVSGTVTARTAVQGMRVMPADTLYDIIDLSSIWVLADIYEVNLPFIRIGQPAEITLAYQPSKVWRGLISFIYPTLDEKTRTVKVRIELPNPTEVFKPEMYANVEFKGSLGKALAVPESAVITTGERSLVFVAKGDGQFEPREVKTGVKIRNFYEIKSGLSGGDKVVTGANFLLDSESKLKAAISGMEGGHQHGQ